MNGVERAERRGDPVAAAEHAPQERPVRLDRVLADGEDHEAGEDHGDEHRAGAGRGPAGGGPRRGSPRAAWSPGSTVGSVTRPPPPCRVAAGHEQAERRRGWRRPGRTCRRARRGRSRRCGRTGSSTSSSSADTSSTAAPWSRSSTIRRWMNSIEPTSRPRVGWATTSSLGSPVSSRAMMTFCWLPPDSVDAATSGLGRAHVEPLHEVARPGRGWRPPGGGRGGRRAGGGSG